MCTHYQVRIAKTVTLEHDTDTQLMQRISKAADKQVFIQYDVFL